MTNNPTVTQADRDAHEAMILAGCTLQTDEELSERERAILAAHRELGKSEGYAQAVDDAVTEVDHFRNAYMNALIVAPESSALLSAIATCEHIIAALKDRTNG